ncbi:PREDICTED: transcription initiation protein SPT3 homolog [Nicrophorus vespilloides]|uniref:Transcription initiation protein SPT3 homolog n=1 Tax=Nicrophorus vespilloides TaxID=110193 RepID=A0ABM1N1Z9_NICVS|nr:PREDICTED: transcription initiation protein SPT3 homolog [Nicrophorus vespilloides]
MEQVTYFNEISLMMFGFGDSHKPNTDTVKLVESITLNQLRLIIHEAVKYQEGNSLGGEELVFLMRKNKYKMRRFIKYLYNKDAKHRLSKGLVDMSGTSTKNTLIEFVEKIDETGELTDLTEYDEVKNERMIRADRISLFLDEETYLKFSQARCTSFRNKNMSSARDYEKLKQWVDPRNELNFSNLALDVLSYYAYETVAQLTDYALLVRLDHNRKGDPLSNLQGTYFSATMFNGEHRLTKENIDYSKVGSCQQPITVNEIKEVMRRICSPQAGKLNFGKKYVESHQIIAI